MRTPPSPLPSSSRATRTGSAVISMRGSDGGATPSVIHRWMCARAASWAGPQEQLLGRVAGGMLGFTFGSPKSRTTRAAPSSRCPAAGVRRSGDLPQAVHVGVGLAHREVLHRLALGVEHEERRGEVGAHDVRAVGEQVDDGGELLGDLVEARPRRLRAHARAVAHADDEEEGVEQPHQRVHRVVVGEQALGRLRDAGRDRPLDRDPLERVDRSGVRVAAQRAGRAREHVVRQVVVGDRQGAVALRVPRPEAHRLTEREPVDAGLLRGDPRPRVAALERLAR